ncbi:ribosomal protein S6 kinase alpha-5 [Echria macrotheca]|uniref:Ribosomal protein S6 kinase alpha-5 n=1 Tax=Echria macrotheca TaxID=438768 RepID=A0AAJ0BBD3_9PEZI|nr:ribosomal protein S6 kinase alpha-5 [Echria macrotheca]
MELTTKTVHDVIHPTAAFSTNPPWISGPAVVDRPWAESQLNPKNRIDSLELPKKPLWRVDGCTGLGTQYYAVPLFLDNMPPMRIDVFIPEEVAGDGLVRELLDLDAAFHTKDGARVARLGIATHIIRTLQAWTVAGGSGGVESVSEMYETLPFGSRIIFENLHLDVRKIRITIAPTYYVEKQLLAAGNLAAVLGVPADVVPAAVDISQLSFVEQIHDSVCLVRMSRDGTRPHTHEAGQLWVFKALTSGTKFLYTELRNLIQLERHPHIIAPPEHIVTKYCRFGGKTAVVGFLLRFHGAGSLRDHVPLLRIHGRLTLAAQLKWATQLTSAVVHVRERGHIFYPDLRLDNVLLSDSGDVVMIDFEQRGVWCEFAAPEVNALEYTRILAGGDPLGQEELESAIQEDVRQRHADLLSRLLPDWEMLQAGEAFEPLAHGYSTYNVPWQCLSPVEQEAAEVYMLGRVLWCIFEGQCAPQHAAVWQSYKREPDLEFPNFRETPAELRELIDRCTRGRRDVLSQLVTRQGSKLVLRGVPREEQNDADIIRVARDWWAAEVKVSEEFLLMREEMKARGAWSGNYYDRPKLREVLGFLQNLGSSLASAGT